MKIVRSTKCSLKFMTESKRHELQGVLAEYGAVVNHFINLFWVSPVAKKDLLKGVVNSSQSWLSARLKKVAAREALDMISSVKEAQTSNRERLEADVRFLEKKIKSTDADSRWKRNKINRLCCRLKAKKNKLAMLQPRKPRHTGKKMSVSCTIASLQKPRDSVSFDAWLHLSCIGRKIGLDLPIKFHQHFNELAQKSTRLNSYVITSDYVQFAFERETGPKKQPDKVVGIDTGIVALASTSEGEQFGTDIREFIERSRRCQAGSRGKQRATNALRQRICEVAKEVTRNIDVIVVEKLSNMNQNSKLAGRTSKNLRSSIGSWNYAYWLDRVQMDCEANRISFRSVLPYYTSQQCPACHHTDSKNRLGTIFKCQSCGYSGNADVVAALNIRDRFLGGPYGAACKSLKYDLSLLEEKNTI